MDTDIDRVTAALPAYEVGGELGHGGWGIVLAGRHRALGRPVAIKQLPPAFATDPGIRRRFTAEGQLLASLDHPHVVPVYDFVEHDGLCLLVMELLPGGTVWNRFTCTGFNAHSAVAVALACAAGLTAAHNRSILHRDIKPENLLFAASGAIKVTDFGIAKVIGGDQTLATKAGDVLGTPSYIAPEQARGGELTPATDVYALATMLYELLAGELPFPPADDAMALLFMHAFDDPTPLQETAPAVPDSIADVVMRGLATDPTLRYPSAEAFGIALAAASTGRWGPGWLTTEGIPVMGADTIVSATGLGPPHTPTLTDSDDHPPLPLTRPHAAPRRPIPGPPGTDSHRADPAATTDPTAPTGSIDPTASPTATAPGSRATEPPPTVRPSITVHAPGARLADVSGADLVNVRTVVNLPSPRVPLVIAAALTAITVLVALLGLGSPPVDVPPVGVVTVAGVDPAGGAPVPLDLTVPVSVTVAGAGLADTATLALDVLDIPVKNTGAAPLINQGGAAVATLPPPGGQYFVAGTLTGTLTLLQAGQVIDTWTFPVRTTQPATTTAAAVGLAALTLFAVAYLESFLRSLRRGRSRITGITGATVTAGVLGAAVVGALWILTARLPTTTTVVACAAVAAAAGAAAAVGAARIGRRRRYRRTHRSTRSTSTTTDQR
ncbi:possible protein kinase [Rhodococcus jostii RHA1]|uniref:non-specific serine/threonine protein kinase n=1 Tax=Rhodococcus jostii (strain RHA1) TaxID=101510 RepID=Q0SBU5_RHOJR|nr:serine/threonine-protein kinase [Rhodococcus jostii]ABG94991.1 possible protein kinase [Rhodococcus jostii RHA1]